MYKLEVHVIEFLQHCLMMESLDLGKNLQKYIELEDELILLTRGSNEKEIYLSTECNIHNLESSLMKSVKMIDNHYKVVWNDVFLYLVGEIDESEMNSSILTNELRMLKISNSPLTNYLKSK